MRDVAEELLGRLRSVGQVLKTLATDPDLAHRHPVLVTMTRCDFLGFNRGRWPSLSMDDTLVLDPFDRVRIRAEIPCRLSPA